MIASNCNVSKSSGNDCIERSTVPHTSAGQIKLRGEGCPRITSGSNCTPPPGILNPGLPAPRLCGPEPSWQAFGGLAVQRLG